MRKPAEIKIWLVKLHPILCVELSMLGESFSTTGSKRFYLVVTNKHSRDPLEEERAVED
jgi:hypothetical protein